MSHTSVSAPPAPFIRIRNLIELGKPRLSFLVVFTAGIGIWMMPGSLATGPTIVFLISTSVLVAAANTLNCWIERDIDGLMHRTCNRPLPMGRVEPATALVVGFFLAGLSLGGLVWSTNLLTTGLALLALISYAWVYTPLKRITPWAVLVGSLPGALPALMGSTAVGGEITAAGLFAFGILFFWQVPHFIAISLYLRDDFQRGGIRVLPLVRGNRVTRYIILATTLLLVGWSLLPAILPFGGPLYLGVATLLGLAFIGVSIPRGSADSSEEWARRIFLYSLIYLPILLTVLVVDLI